MAETKLDGYVHFKNEIFLLQNRIFIVVHMINETKVQT